MLNRDAIRSGAFLESFNFLPPGMLWTQSQIDQSLAQTMARRPTGEDVWIFAYGSLMWNPLSCYDRREIATLQGWHRSFCIRLLAGRGTPQRPGRMLALEPGGCTQGVALRLATTTLDEELRILWTREMLTGAYTPTWTTVTLATGETQHALAFVASNCERQYEADSHPAKIARLIAHAQGPLGTNAEYVFRLRQALADCALSDPYIEDVAHALAGLETKPL
ncbi:cation transport protein ChaC [Paraburkholderia unamae]|uniref:glutathione-specific gamma-glutamylcyclotransferase n=2 Tax=Paraburkholderia unamae TaxID=219649 RepID=A0ABX5KLI2_9BURK|nr:gamma-glutamylcyclotransferase [Paraburkholderia unamae]PVX82877.1 cation transport protein ChaC [Paraburkholderia unamae]CAG9269038.1 Glutathione-specific gamma-glutamylcyclotransferase [Paraburkholderia unamae]